MIDELVENYNLKNNKPASDKNITTKKPPFIIVLEKQIDLFCEKEMFNLKNRRFCWLYKRNLILAVDNTNVNNLILYSYKNESIYIEKNIKGHTSTITHLDISNNFIVSASNFGEVIFWEFFTGNLQIVNKYCDTNLSPILDIYIDSKLLLIAISFKSGCICVFNFTNGE